MEHCITIGVLSKLPWFVNLKLVRSDIACFSDDTEAFYRVTRYDGRSKCAKYKLDWFLSQVTDATSEKAQERSQKCHGAVDYSGRLYMEHL